MSCEIHQDEKKRFSIAGFLLFLLLVSCSFMKTDAAYAGLVPMDESEMDGLIGQTGFGIGLKDIKIFQFINAYRFTDTTNSITVSGHTISSGYLEFAEIKVHSSNNGPWELNPDNGSSPPTGAMFFGVGSAPIASEEDWNLTTNPTSEKKLMADIYAPYWEQDKIYTVGKLSMIGPHDPAVNAASPDYGVTEIGGFSLGSMDVSSFYLALAPLGSGGLEFEYDFQLNIDHFIYSYNDNFPFSNSNTFRFNKISFGNSFADYTGDDPRYPSTWKTNNNVDIGEFSIGDIYGDTSSNVHSNPAFFEIDQFDISGTQYLATAFNLPMYGAIRFEKMMFGGTDFGPGTIDGLNAYRLQVMLVP